MSWSLGLNDFFQYEFLQVSLLATTLMAFISGTLSPIIIAKKYAFIGSAISHSTLLGVALALSLFSVDSSIGVYLVTLSSTLVLTFFLAYTTFKQNLPSDSIIGIFFSVTMGAGIIVFNLFAKEKGQLLSFLFGNILLLSSFEIILLIILSVICFVLILKRKKQWLYMSFDEDSAKISGLKTEIYHFGLFFLITVVIVSSLKIAGTVLINTLLLIPGYYALRFSRNASGIFRLSIIFSLVSSFLGLVAANMADLPPGATLCVVQFLLLSLAILKKKFYQ